ncbi:mitochondrial ribonuclease P catalytic subunit [Chanos chanos]|uniref:Mitochondrial ribonuclease P catalytic subunit n=1 Tax=Chanos chanos TaxID=29144 RepID=A0A6J2WIN5_CHACN|nr:mitochondrial ribonuclease P catalytic subunit [Chanos chanos]
MGSFLMSKSRICFRHLCPLLGSAKILPYPKDTLLLVQRTAVTPVPALNKLSRTQFYCTKGRGIKRAQAFGRDAKQKDFTVKEWPVSHKSVFAAGTAKRASELLKKKSGIDIEEEASVTKRTKPIEIPDHPLTASEWRKLKESSTRRNGFELQMMTGLLTARADIDIAKSLLAYVATETGSLSYKLLVRYLTICVSGRHHSEVFDTYDIMKSCFPALDTGAYTLFIKGFSQTERWRETLAMLENVKKVLKPSARNYGDVIAGAMLHGDSETGWSFYRELLDKGLSPNQDTWRCLFESGITHRGHEEEVQSMLTHMRDNQIYPEESVANSIKAWFESLPGEKWKGRFTTVDSRGVCRSCHAKLESIQLTGEEYTQLKNAVMRDVIEGKDVFTKTTPEELETFKRFVRQRPAFDVVVDGLNVANTSGKGSQSETLLAVVTELEQKGLSILVLGRRHMLHPSKSWDRHHMTQIKQKAHCFFTDNISEDDPFLLYAALHSGNHCNFVSRDLMRDHKACLPDSATRRLFFKWQRGHQIVISQYTPGRRVRFQNRESYDTILQSDRTSWHVPYDEEGSDRCSYEVPQKWLCLTKAH